jgi:methyl-accepting chemotaxis protein
MADVKEEISKAIGAHGLWKMRLSTAITTGKLDAKVEDIRVDNKCAFGQFIYGKDISTAERNGEHFKKIRDLHAEFHKTAAHVADLAISGKKDEAKKVMDAGAYKKISSDLTAAMMAWKGKIAN